MAEIIFYDPAVGSINLGDEIISLSCREALHPYFCDDFITTLSTHTPASVFLLKYVMNDAKIRLVLGSNLLMGKLNGRFRQWDINYYSAKYVGPVTLMGVGWWQHWQDWNTYTKATYKRVLSSEGYHSVRDELTRQKLQEMGFKNVLNTGCPTTWMLTPDHCAAIPRKTGKRVITTLTDYMPEPERDRAMLNCLSELYEEVYLWIQGMGDVNYIGSLSAGLKSKPKFIRPTVSALVEGLSKPDVDYVGTRLHAGIYALRHGVRSLIIGVDSRSLEMQKDIGLPVLPAAEIDGLGQLLSSEIETKISLPEKEIQCFLEQFKK